MNKMREHYILALKNLQLLMQVGLDGQSYGGLEMMDMVKLYRTGMELLFFLDHPAVLGGEEGVALLHGFLDWCLGQRELTGEDLERCRALIEKIGRDEA